MDKNIGILRYLYFLMPFKKDLYSVRKSWFISLLSLFPKFKKLIVMPMFMQLYKLPMNCRIYEKTTFMAIYTSCKL